MPRSWRSFALTHQTLFVLPKWSGSFAPAQIGYQVFESKLARCPEGHMKKCVTFPWHV